MWGSIPGDTYYLGFPGTYETRTDIFNPDHIPQGYAQPERPPPVYKAVAARCASSAAKKKVTKLPYILPKRFREPRSIGAPQKASSTSLQPETVAVPFHQSLRGLGLTGTRFMGRTQGEKQAAARGISSGSNGAAPSTSTSSSVYAKKKGRPRSRVVAAVKASKTPSERHVYQISRIMS
jgi:hypothetical protein